MTQYYGKESPAQELASRRPAFEVAHPGRRTTMAQRRAPWLRAVARATLRARLGARNAMALHAVLFAGLILVLSIVALVRARDFRPVQHPDVWRGKLAHAFETHYDQVFPLKNLGVNLWAAIDYELFHEGRSGVVVGKDGWLYTDEEFRLDEDSPARIGRNLALIGWVKHTLAQHHVALLVAVVPAKARVYPEHLDHKRPPDLRRKLYARTLRALSADGIVAAGLLRPLRRGKRDHPTFLRTDTHWTPYGARLAAQAIAARTGDFVDATDTFHTQAEGTQVHRGDLFNFLPLDPWFGWLLPPPDKLTRFRTVADERAEGLLGADPSPEVALVGTSYSAEAKWNFAGALEQALHADVLNYAKDGQGPFVPMLAYLHSADFRTSPPKLVIWEVPERYLTLAQTGLARYHLPPDAFVARASAPATARGSPGLPGGDRANHAAPGDARGTQEPDRTCRYTAGQRRRLARPGKRLAGQPRGTLPRNCQQNPPRDGGSFSHVTSKP